ncbi:glutaminase A [Blastococcus goldschmidtiae]|uniref:Glutaminase n=1 Tax=Blastococcus goldschmidtiae TaxID=3075546 RepID=A0ABU2KC65_9ACTN|nr:glutaminase A [Blastococcus sp. DSM 46792]MDT0277772.1 glutaminase A [Blastococcus sp. DSM 46792]
MPTTSSDLPDDLTGILDDVAAEARPLAEDDEVDEPGNGPDRFALALCELDGTEHVAGDADVGFEVQSVVKVFALAAALQHVGEDVFRRVGREPSGDPYDSLVQLEREHGVPRNPFINAGAVVVCDVLVEATGSPDGARAAVTDLLSDLVGERLEPHRGALDEERAGSSMNLAMGHLMSSFDNFRNPVADVVDAYAQLCALAVTTRQLARAARFLAADGVNPRTGDRVLTEPLARRVNAVMMTCGTYDAAGQFAYDVGFPCKSGVDGAVMGDVPNRFGVCAWSPPLDAAGNSRAGRAALHLLSERLGLSLL